MAELPDWLSEETYRVEHCPSCPSRYLVRLVQWGRGTIDGTELDARGYGKTLAEAAERARIQREAVKALTIAKRMGVSVPGFTEPQPAKPA